MSENNGHHPTNDDMTEVKRLLDYIASLNEQLFQAREALNDAWARVPFDPETSRKPWRSEIAKPCMKCGQLTKWRNARAEAAHDGECPKPRPGVIERQNFNALLDDILNMEDDEVEDVQDGETLEHFVRRKSGETVQSTETVKPSEREN